MVQLSRVRRYLPWNFEEQEVWIWQNYASNKSVTIPYSSLNWACSECETGRSECETSRYFENESTGADAWMHIIESHNNYYDIILCHCRMQLQRQVKKSLSIITVLQALRVTSWCVYPFCIFLFVALQEDWKSAGI